MLGGFKRKSRIAQVLLLSLSLLHNSGAVAQELSNEQSNQTTAELSPTLFFHSFERSVLAIPGPVDQSQIERFHMNKGLDTPVQPTISLSQYNTNNFLALLTKVQKLDEQSQNYGKNLAAYIDDGEVVTGQQLHLLFKVFAGYHLVGIRINEFTKNTNPWTVTQSRYFINPNDSEETKKHLIWLLGQIELGDKYLRAYKTFYTEEGKLRRMIKSMYKINKDTKEVADELLDNLTGILSKESVERMAKFIKQMKDAKRVIEQLSTVDPQVGQLVRLIESNASFKQFESGKKIKLKTYSFIDGFVNLGQNIVYYVSKVFGNLAGAMRFRKGYLYNNANVANEIKSQLKPLDVIFEKTPFALTDKFIPGYFGHAALWLGTESELKELGMWDHPAIVPYHNQILAGNSIVEALRPGVSMNTMLGFMNIDHIAVLRVKDVLSMKEEIPGIYERTMRNIGNDYDFNFDVTTTDRIVCSELIYHAFGFIKFPTKWRLGRPTIEPDLIAEVNFYENSPTEFLYFVESFKKDQIERLPEMTLGERLGFKLNQDQTTAQDNVYNKTYRKCYTIQVPSGKNGNEGFDKERVCTTVEEPVVYEAPSDLGTSMSDLDFAQSL